MKNNQVKQRRQEPKWRTTREDKKQNNEEIKNNEASQATNQKGNGGSDEGQGNRLRLNVSFLNRLSLCGFVPGVIFYSGLVGVLSFLLLLLLPCGFVLGVWFGSWSGEWRTKEEQVNKKGNQEWKTQVPLPAHTSQVSYTRVAIVNSSLKKLRC